MAPRIGIQTIVWGQGLPALSELVKEVSSVGYEGIEFAQTPNQICVPKDRGEFLNVLGDLTVVGLSGGTIAERVKFCDDTGLLKLPVARRPYLYVHDWDRDEAPIAIDAGLTQALHPHQFHPVGCLREAQAVLQTHTEKIPLPDGGEQAQLGFLPDTAHLWLAGDGLIRTLEETRDRLVAVHMKDWCPDYGRSFGNYARGFTELGCGIVPLDDVWDWLRDNYDGWVIVEQDCTERDPIESVRMSWEWLKGTHRSSVACVQPVKTSPLPKPSDPMQSLAEHSGDAVRILDVISRDSSRGIDHLYQSITGCFGELLNGNFCSLWEISPRTETMTLQAFWPPDLLTKPSITDLKVANALSASAAAHRATRVFPNIRNEAELGRFKDVGLVKTLGVDFMVSVPIHNSYNINQPEVVLNVLFVDPPGPIDEDFLGDIGKHVALAVETAWNDLCARATAEFDNVSSNCKTVKELTKCFVQRVQTYTKSIGASVFFVNPSEDRLCMAYTTGLVGDADYRNISYKKGAGLPGKTWEAGDVRISLDADRDERIAADDQPKEFTDGASRALILLPLADSVGRITGVLRCRGKKCGSIGLSNHFSVTDEIVLRALSDAFHPHLQRLMTAERRGKAFTRMTHELKVPVVVVQGATELIRAEMNDRGWRFSDDFLGDIEGYMDLMKGLLRNAAYLKEQPLVLRPENVLLYRDVAVPACRQVRQLLKEKRFSAGRIDVSGLRDIPAMHLDKQRFQQVFFNLISNAIKYAFKDPSAFRMEICYRHIPGRIEITFRDWGPGVDDEMRDAIFKEGVRGPDAHLANVEGDGLGLYIVQEIVLAHSGSVGMGSCRLPTEFVISLPLGGGM